MRTTVVLILLLVVLPMAVPAADEKLVCPFAEKRPPLETILKQPGEQRPALCKANLTRADLTGADLRQADLREANLREATLIRADLTGARLFDADLARANLAGANLTWANLSRANLTGARLTRTNLTRANLTEADLAGANFEPEPGSVGSTRGIEFARNLSQLTFRSTPTGLVVLREHFAKLGLRVMEREVTFAKLRTQRVLAWQSGSFLRRVESFFLYVAFELTCGYGLYYGHPLRVLGALIPLMALIYAWALRGRGDGAIWRVWQPDRVRKDQGQTEPERLSWEPGAPSGSFFRLCRALGLGLLFSLLSAFQIGWRELNVGNWITRLQPRQHSLQATGWVRVVSGAQSLFSVYLLALWVLTYFGRPFE